MFFLVYFDKTDYKLIVFLALQGKHSRNLIRDSDFSGYVHWQLPKISREEIFQVLPSLSFISLLMLFLRNSLSISLVCCFDVDLRQSTSELSEGNLEEER